MDGRLGNYVTLLVMSITTFFLEYLNLLKHARSVFSDLRLMRSLQETISRPELRPEKLSSLHSTEIESEISFDVSI